MYKEGLHLPAPCRGMDDFGIHCDWDAIVECCDFLTRAKNDEGMGKLDVIESVENRMHILMRRFVHKAVFPHAASRMWPLILSGESF